MKKLFTFFLLMLSIISVDLTAQQDVMLRINHTLSGQDFEMNAVATNNMSIDFKVTRLEYYISEISVIHDNGQETKINDLWHLAQADQVSEINLGSLNVTNIEGVSFYVGVDEAHNHLDPSSYASGHPLAPKNPSMHWGWAAGYRFVAMEGKTGTNFSTTFQFHGLGDINYFKTSLDLQAIDENGVSIIEIDADYTNAVKDINLTSGPISHGDFGEAKQCLVNFNSSVFSASSSVGVSILADDYLAIQPNPNFGSANLVINSENAVQHNIEVLDGTGRLINSFKTNLKNESLQFPTSGIYFVKISDNTGNYLTKKVVVQ